MKSFFRTIAHLIFRTGQFNLSNVKKFACGVHNSRILELGSGRSYKQRHPYSLKHLFDPSNEFIRSDILREYGHRIVDVTKRGDMGREKYDVILCTNVLEHVYDFNGAVSNIHAALKRGGTAIIFVPAFYPLHDEPGDYWRFTEHSLRRLLKNFGIVRLRHLGLRRYPFAYFAELRK